MRTIQALRRSIKGEKDRPQVSIAPKSAVAIVPPKKVSTFYLSSINNLTRFCHIEFDADARDIYRLFELFMIMKPPPTKS